MPKDVCSRCRQVKDVKLCADDLLCSDCDNENERQLATIRGQRPTAHSTPTAMSGSETSLKQTSMKSTTAAAQSLVADAQVETGNRFVVSEMLSYMKHYRDSSSAEKLRKTVVGFYSATEIMESKKKLITAVDSKLPSDCPFRVERRKSSVRPAHDAEVEDVIGIFDVLDRMKALNGITFAAVAIDRIPKYAPEETNIATLVGKHDRLESVITDMAAKIESLSSSSINETQNTEIGKIDSKLAQFANNFYTSSTEMNATLTMLTSVCTKLAASVQTSTTSRTSDPPAPVIDRTRNVIIAGVAEDRNKNVWYSTVQRVLHTAANRDVQICDAFRVGGRYTPNRNRPILVRLQTVWDRRIVLDGARRLAGDNEFHGRIYINADEPVEVRRQNMMRRLKSKAERDGKAVIVSQDGVLMIDNVPVFSVQHGFVRPDVSDVSDDVADSINHV